MAPEQSLSWLISQDVESWQSIPSKLDKENPNFGWVSACKRVARSLYMGTALGANRERKGINDQRVKLACVMPGEPIAVFGDALRRHSFMESGPFVALFSLLALSH